jgi:protein SCO1
MRQHRATRWMILAGVALAAALAAGSVGAAPSDSPWGADYFPKVTLTTQDGQPVQFYDELIKGKIVVINFMYTNCVDACPLKTAELVQVQKLLGDRMGKDIFFYSITYDPARDTPAVLKAYMAKHQVGPGWTFLTGKKAEIDLLRQKLGLYYDADVTHPFGHTPTFVVGNEATGQWMRSSAFDNPTFLAAQIGGWLVAGPDKKDRPDHLIATIAQGQAAFQKSCASCHTIGKGRSVGPDLQNVTLRRDLLWIVRWLAGPEQMVEDNDPTALAVGSAFKRMPVMPSLALSDAETHAILLYLDSTRTGTRAAVLTSGK